MTTETLDRREAALRLQLAQPERDRAAAVAELEQIAAEREGAARGEAEQRLLGIARAHGSLIDQLERDEERLQAAAAAYQSLATQLNARFKRITDLRAERAALLDRFPGLAAPTLPSVVAPIRRAGCAQAQAAVDAEVFIDFVAPRQAVEHCPHRLRSPRRTFAEIRGTPGFEIIEAAGVPDFPALTAAQQRLVAKRAASA